MEHLAVERLVVLVGAVLRGAGVERRGVVDRLGLLLLHLLPGLVPGLHLVAIFVGDGRVGLGGLLLRLGLDLVQIDRPGHERAVALQHLAHAPDVQELLLRLADVQRDGGAARRARALGHGEGHAVLALPAHGRRALAEGQRVDGHLVRDHEHGVEAQAEVADDAAVLLVVLLGVLLQEALCAGEGDLVDVFLHLVLGHAHAVVDEAQLLCRLVHLDMHGAALGELVVHHAQLGDGVAGVGDDLTDKDILIGIEPFLDDRHDILRVDGHAALNRIHIKNLLIDAEKPCMLWVQRVLYRRLFPMSREN